MSNGSSIRKSAVLEGHIAPSAAAAAGPWGSIEALNTGAPRAAMSPAAAVTLLSGRAPGATSACCCCPPSMNADPRPRSPRLSGGKPSQGL